MDLELRTVCWWKETARGSESQGSAEMPQVTVGDAEDGGQGLEPQPPLQPEQLCFFWFYRRARWGEGLSCQFCFVNMDC